MKTRNRTIRIIAGKHRGRRLSVPDIEGLRPCPNRVRETVFNWLQFELAGAVVLDAFAGSGAMGLEALSRGAKYAVFADKNPVCISQIQKILHEWQGNNARICRGDALSLPASVGAYDVIFSDPPFAAQQHQAAVKYFTRQDFLKPHGKLYTELPYPHAQLPLPPDCYWYKQSKAGNVYFGLICRRFGEQAV